MKDLGVKQAPFVVLIGAAMPSVLAEISFVTNRRKPGCCGQSVPAAHRRGVVQRDPEVSDVAEESGDGRRLTSQSIACRAGYVRPDTIAHETTRDG